MGSIRRRVEKLEARTGAMLPAKPGPTTLDEIHRLEREIAKTEAEMRAAGMSEAEIKAVVKGGEELTLEEEMRLLEEEIARVEAERG